jgi:hypothetical protein
MFHVEHFYNSSALTPKFDIAKIPDVYFIIIALRHALCKAKARLYRKNHNFILNILLEIKDCCKFTTFNAKIKHFSTKKTASANNANATFHFSSYYNILICQGKIAKTRARLYHQPPPAR